jgi:hypothetical protein
VVAIGITLSMVAITWVRGVVLARNGMTRADCLAELDRHLGAGDRLQAADQFRSLPPSPFVEAALLDARPWLERYSGVPLSVPLSISPIDVWHYGHIAGAGIVVVLLMAVSWPRQIVNPDAGQLAVGDSRRVVQSTPDTPDPQSQEPAPPESAEHVPARIDPQAVAAAALGADLEHVEPTAGRTRAGRASNAEAASATGQSRGQPSNQQQPAADGGKDKPRSRKTAQRRRPESEATDPARQPQQEESGKTSGRGSSKGSSRNPAASHWSSRDRVETPEPEDELENDADIDDETEDQEARGGLQPTLRDRRPPPSRDLTIGFGNRPSPDANQRGGPSEPKKSRGTASLVLGVPIPDFVKGQPGPGKTKVTQQRVQPQPSATSALDAEDRGQRTEATGPVMRPALEPWMRVLLQRYFVSNRPSEDQP